MKETETDHLLTRGEGSANFFRKGTDSKYFSFTDAASEGGPQLCHCSMETAIGNR